MAKKANPERKNTTVSISKNPTHLLISQFRAKSTKREGNETDGEVVEKFAKFYAQHNKPINENGSPTYPVTS